MVYNETILLKIASGSDCCYLLYKDAIKIRKLAKFSYLVLIKHFHRLTVIRTQSNSISKIANFINSDKICYILFIFFKATNTMFGSLLSIVLYFIVTIPITCFGC